MDCIFCRIIAGEIPCYKIYENESVLAFLDIAGDFYGHTLVIPKGHYENIFEVPHKELGKVMDAVKLISEHYKNNCGFSGVNILNASGSSAEQSVMHLHFHIIPRKENDNLHMWPQGHKDSSDFAESRKKLKLNGVE